MDHDETGPPTEIILRMAAYPHGGKLSAHPEKSYHKSPARYKAAFQSALCPRSHGFYRFFAWLILWGLFLLNAGSWFRDALAWHQLISLLFLGWGMFFKSPTWLEAGLALICTCFLVATARVEERENTEYFGEAYVDYMRDSRMFIPFIF